MKSKSEIKLMSALSLAFIGDAVHSLFAREYTLSRADLMPKDFQKETVKIVRAKNQSNVLMEIESELNEDEKDIEHRARNAKTNNVPKNCEMIEYKRSTAFEAIIGYLYLCGEKERMEYFLNKSLKVVTEK